MKHVGVILIGLVSAILVFWVAVSVGALVLVSLGISTHGSGVLVVLALGLLLASLVMRSVIRKLNASLP